MSSRMALRVFAPGAGPVARPQRVARPAAAAVACRPRPCANYSVMPSQQTHRSSVLVRGGDVSLSSVDVIEVETKSSYEPGYLVACNSENQAEELIKTYSDKLIVFMCKSTTCKPCKAYMPTYAQLAERFKDSVFVTIVGNASPELRQLMKKWQVKATPTFRVYRDGENVDQFSGTGGSKLKNAILPLIKDDEAGKDWTEQTHTELKFNSSSDE